MQISCCWEDWSLVDDESGEDRKGWVTEVLWWLQQWLRSYSEGGGGGHLSTLCREQCGQNCIFRGYLVAWRIDSKEAKWSRKWARRLLPWRARAGHMRDEWTRSILKGHITRAGWTRFGKGKVGRVTGMMQRDVRVWQLLVKIFRKWSCCSIMQKKNKLILFKKGQVWSICD